MVALTASAVVSSRIVLANAVSVANAAVPDPVK
jgi:hypothetical protein